MRRTPCGRPHAPRSRVLPSRHRCAEALEPRTLLAADPASLLKDVNTHTASSVPTDVTPLGTLTLFRADDGVHGNEWFRTDGTAAGTSLLKDINPGEAGSRPASGPSAEAARAAAVGGTVFFTAADASRGAELWKTDGTPGGTVLVKDIRPGVPGSSPTNLTAVGNTLYFVANDGTNGVELWKSDGTEAGPVMVADLAPGSATAAPVPIGVLNGRLFFAARAPDAGQAPPGRELWVTDGTAAGTTLVKNIHPSGGSEPGVIVPAISNPPRTETVVSGGALYFAATDPAHGRELWKTDGTPNGTVLVADMTPGPAHTSPVDLTVTMATVNGARLESVYFTGRHAEQPISAVYRTRPGGGAELVQSLSHNRGLTTGMGNGGFLILAQPYMGTPGLYVHYPHWPAGTPMRLVKEMTTLPPVEGNFRGGGSHIFFLAPGAEPNTVALWRTSGFSGATLVATHPATGPNATDTNARWVLSVGGNGLYYAANDPRYGTELHRVNVDGAGSGRVADLNKDTLGGVESAVGYVNGPAGGRGLFVADDGVHGREVWVTDGTEAGTVLLKDITPGPVPGIRTAGEPMFSPDINGLVYFRANASGTRPDESPSLWVTDGTAAGTRSVGVAGAEVVSFRGKAHILAGPDLWVTDGTAAGTTLVADLDPMLRFRDAVAVGDTMYIFAVRQEGGTELWKTDGTQAGTSLVARLSEQADVIGNNPPAAALGDALYFITQPASGHGEPTLWRTDGTEAGTRVVRQLPQVSSRLTQMVAAGGKVLLEAGVEGAADISRTTVWVADDAGARPLPDVAPATADLSAVSGLTPAGDFAFFFAQPPGRTALELWRTDGTAAGTTRLTEPSASPRPLGVVDGVYYFAAGNTATGTELWRSDGSGAGTFMVQDIRPGAGGADPRGLAAAGNRIYFIADDGTHGRELWSMPRAAATGTVVGRRVFYNNSAFDGADPAATAADLAAVAPDKAALRPGEAATFANVTSFDKGINGVLIDFAGLPDATLGVDDFAFHSGRTADPATWGPAPAPASVTLLPTPLGAAVTRYAITWPDGSLVNTWLRVTVKANERTALPSPDVFFFGNLVGETGAEGPTGSGPAGGGARLLVSGRDLVSMRRRQAGNLGIDSPYDINRDRALDVRDMVLVRRNLFRSLPLIGGSPAVAPTVLAASATSAARAAPAPRGVFSDVVLNAAEGKEALLA